MDVDRHTSSPLVVVRARVPAPRAKLVRRERLLQLLNDEADRRITLIQAPAGYGKSSVLAQWAESDPLRRFGWLTLEATDNDPVLFLRDILFALRALVPGFADKAWGLLHGSQPDLDALVTHVLNASLDVPGRIVLILDDYHVIANPRCHDLMQHFVDHLPSSMQVAFGTRTRPPLSLSKFETSGLGLTIDTNALQFTPEETKEAIDKAGDRLGSEAVARVQHLTEGWPAAVHLYAISVDPISTGNDLPSGVSAVNSYLLEEMLNHFSDGERSDLAKWSILRHLNGHLCDRVAVRKGSAKDLRQLSQANLLLIPLDTNGDWYRFHDLLVDALQREFAEHPPEQQRAAHRLAMEWWLENDNVAQAIHHALEAGEHQRAAELLCANWLEYMLNGLLETVREWIDRFPTDTLLVYPPILIASAWIMAFSGRAKETREFAARARALSFDGPMVDGTTSYTSALAILQAGLGLDGMEDGSRHAEHAYHIEPLGSPWRPLAAALAGVYRFGLGHYEGARIALAEAAQTLAGEDGVATYARGQLALLELHEGNWAEGSRQAELACEQIEESNLGDLLSSGAAKIASAAAKAHFGDRASALDRIRSLASIQQVLSDAIPFDAFQINLVAAETYLLLGDFRSATIHARAALSRLEAFGDAGIFEERLTEVQRVLASEDDAVDGSEAEPETLTDRELQVLILLPSDLSVREIGRELYVSRNTAKSHVASLYRKLGVTSRTAAIARACQLDLIS